MPKLRLWIKCEDPLLGICEYLQHEISRRPESARKKRHSAAIQRAQVQERGRERSSCAGVPSPLTTLAPVIGTFPGSARC